MSDKKQEVIRRLDAIIKPKQEHVDNLKVISADGKHPVTSAFLAMYQEELVEYKELKMAIMEAFLEI